MKYFVVEGTFKKDFPMEKQELEKAIKDHIEYLQKGFNEGWILVSGPKTYSGGGFMVIKSEDLEKVQEFLESDPLKKSGIQEYTVTEFKMHDCQEIVKDWLE